jgi:hypothetical protein
LAFSFGVSLFVLLTIATAVSMLGWQSAVESRDAEILAKEEAEGLNHELARTTAELRSLVLDYRGLQG